MAKPVKTNLDDASGSQSFEQFWSNIFSEAQFLCTPSRVCDDRRQYPSTPTSLSSTGPKSSLHGQTNVFQTNCFADHVRAEGSVCKLRHTGESSGHPASVVSPVDEMTKPILPRHSKRKKSWLRVVRRVARYGSARYRGKWWTSNQVPASDLSYVQEQTAVSGRQHRTITCPPPPSPGRAKRLVRFLCWNCGGLPPHKYDEAMSLARRELIDIFALVETRKNSFNIWNSAEFTVVQSGEAGIHKQAYSGITLLIRNPDEIRYNELIPGRLLHCIIKKKGWAVPLEVLTVYQKWLPHEASSDAAELAIKVRSHLWTELDRALAKIPKRHSLIVFGDFNTHVPKASPMFSSGDPSHAPSPDSDDFIEICRRHNLYHCHRHQGKAAATFQLGRQGGTRIDYVFMRQNMRACISDMIIDWRCPLLGTSTGGTHAILAGGFRTQWACWRSCRSPSPRSASLDHALLRSAQHDAHPLHKQFRCLLESKAKTLTSFDEISVMVNDAGLSTFGRQKKSKQAPPWSQENLQHACKCKWDALAKVRSLATSCPSKLSLCYVFRFWLAVIRAEHKTRIYKQLGRQLRRNWLENIFSQAQLAADKRDASLFKVVRLLAPKSARAPQGCRTKLEHACTLEEEIGAFAEHYRQLFRAPDPAQVLCPPNWQWSTPCTCNDLDTLFQKMPLFKGVPRGHAIGAVWRIALRVTTIRDILDRQLLSMPSTGVPKRFSDGNLLLLPKPGKSGRDVTHYRPLVLQCPVGKSILRWVSNRVLQLVRPLLLQHPQFAYLPGRSAEMAILKVQNFLDERYRKGGYAIAPAEWIKSGWQAPECTGCLLVSLDLSQAFDRVNRVELIRCLQALHLPSDIIGIIWAWHLNPEYHLSIGSRQAQIPTSRGVRQGCTIAPLLWVIFLYSIVERLCLLRPDVDWLKLLTEFADDLILCFSIDSVLDLGKALETLRFFLSFLADSGLVVNMAKTQFLLRVLGKSSKKILDKHTFRQNGRRYLRLSEHHTPELSDHILYLGIHLGWRRSADLALKHRIACGKRSFAALLPWWRSSITKSLKVRLFLQGCSPQHHLRIEFSGS